MADDDAGRADGEPGPAAAAAVPANRSLVASAALLAEGGVAGAGVEAAAFFFFFGVVLRCFFFGRWARRGKGGERKGEKITKREVEQGREKNP